MPALPPPACVSRLRIHGFKTFADPVALDILPGLTGLVGPNGCGKSNVVDALRWAMGEGNARTLRGAEMEDVIFAGTASRPGMHQAEVALTLDGGSFPAPFADLAAVQVTRRIERGAGSVYQVNGREARARDVQALFADLAGGARSFSMVGQGRVGALVQARPEERRGLLDEAAGIAGLRVRRLEAEGKLRAAEANLLRAGDRRQEMDARLDGLRRQARQSERHHELSASIAVAEAGLLARVRAAAAAARDAAAAALAAAQGAAAQAALQAVAAAADMAATAAALPSLRQAEAAARAAADRARLAQEGQDAADARARLALTAAADQHAQATRDLAHAEGLAKDAAAAEARLAEEAQRLAGQDAASPAHLAQLQADATQAFQAVQEADAAATAAIERAAALAADARARADALVHAEAYVRRAVEAAARLGAEQDRVIRATVEPARLAEAATATATADAASGAARSRLDIAVPAVSLATAAAIRAREAASRADAAHARLAAEAGALAEVLAADAGAWPPILDRLQVPPGLEAALGAALGEDLSAAADTAAPRHWRQQQPLPLRPLAGQSLAELLQVPQVLQRALSGVGIVADETEGDAAQAGLLPGQCLVSCTGAMWRWDGFTVRAGTPAVAATRLRQRNRMARLQRQLQDTEAVAAAARDAKTAADAAEREAAAAEVAARVASRDADAWAGRARQAAALLQAASNAAAETLARLDAQAAALALEAADAAAMLDQAQVGQAALPEPAALQAEAARARAALQAAHTSDAAAAQALDAARRDGAVRRDRLAALAREREGWAVRAVEARRRATELRARQDAAQADHAHLLTRQAGRGDEAAAALRQAHAGQRTAATALATAERRADEAATAARAAEMALAETGNALVRAEAAAGQAAQAWAALPPGPDAAPPSLSAGSEASARAGLAALLRERDALGPVNPYAEAEAAAATDRSQAVARECDELTTSIAALRASLVRLDRDARAKLSAVFGQVDRQFQALFSRMFGGGRAQLALVGPDDPLEAGLDVVAQPPGKVRARLSLLSGGEQALTALCLLFAVFRCNPAPLCVLDEVDAPLDDANVDRFCTLLADMARDAGTRFLVVTHHGLTMARMDRLLGVTMGERGVSQLLSVDLRQAAAWAGDAAPADRPALLTTRS